MVGDINDSNHDRDLNRVLILVLTFQMTEQRGKKPRVHLISNPHHLLCFLPIYLFRVSILVSITLNNHGFIHIEVEIVQNPNNGLDIDTFQRILLFYQAKVLVNKVVVCTPREAVNDGTGGIDGLGDQVVIDGAGCTDVIPNGRQENVRQSAAPELTLTTPLSEPTECPNPAMDLDVVDGVEGIGPFVSVRP